MSGYYFGTYQRLGVPVWSSNRVVIRAARLLFTLEARKSLKFRNQRHMMYRRLIGHHVAEQRLARRFAL